MLTCSFFLSTQCSPFSTKSHSVEIYSTEKLKINLYFLPGLVFHAVAVSSGSWLIVSQFNSGYYQPCVRGLASDSDKQDKECWVQKYDWVQISSVGLWAICFMSSPPPNKTVSYCADFAEDYVPGEQTAVVGILRSLSFSRWSLGFPVSWACGVFDLKANGICKMFHILGSNLLGFQVLKKAYYFRSPKLSGCFS